MSGWGNSIVISVGESIAVSVPRRQLLERTFKRWVHPCGSEARQSVKVPPVSTQTRQPHFCPSVASLFTVRGLLLDWHFYAEAVGLKLSVVADEKHGFFQGMVVAFYNAGFCGANG